MALHAPGVGVSLRRRDFESIMLSTRATLSLTTRRLSDGEFRAMIGMLCLAGDSQERGLLLVGGTAASVAEIADFAKCKAAAARSAITKLIEMETLERLEDGTLAFTNWDRFQPAPKASDTPEARRDRKARSRASHANVTRDIGPDVTPLSRDPFAGAIVRREEEGKRTTPKPPPGVSEVWDAWRESTGHADAVLSDKRIRLIRKGLGSYPVRDLVDAVRGWKRSPHHRGENDRLTEYNSIELLLRDSEKIEFFRNLERSGAGGNGSSLAGVKL
jgi:hypothetical protein